MYKQFRDSNYEISTEGKVRNPKKDLVLKTRLDRYGYEIITLHFKGKAETFKVHRLVAEVFIPNPENKPQVNHKDNERTNNNADNLEWTTARENILHAISTGGISLDKLREHQKKWCLSDEAKLHGKALGLKYKEKNLKQYTSGKV